MALALSGSAVAESPYNTPYGVQWNFQIGTGGNDMGGGSRIAVTSDGTVFVNNRTGESTWGSGIGGNVRGGLGAITPLGQLLYGTTVSSLPTLNSPGQQYAAGVNTAGNKAYFTVYGAQSQFWTGEDGKDANRAMVWSMDSTGLNSVADQHSLSKFTNAEGNLRTDTLQPTTTGLTPAGGSNRITASALRESTLDMVMTMDMVSGDFATAGDYEGYLLRNDNTNPAFLPGIGVYNFTTNILSGPAKQPILTHRSATGSNMGAYTAAGIDQSTGWYYGGGTSHTRTESSSDSWDPDGSGPTAPIPLPNGQSGIGTAYNELNILQYSVTWDTTGFDTINFIAPTNDGTNSVFWAGEQLDDCFIELRDASGSVVWSDSFDQSSDGGVERIVSVKVDTNGDILVTGYFENGGSGGGADTYDTFVRKYEKTAPNTYAVKWDTTSNGPVGARDLIYDSALDPTDKTLYLLSDSFGQVNNTTGFLYAGNSDLLVQKMIAGDFNSDGVVDFENDVQTAGAATKPGDLVGDDTYDFDGDGNSTFADTEFMITTIMDRSIGDIHQDTNATDVDNADIGKAIGSHNGAAGSGKLYFDGDIDFDGNVDDADIAAVAGAFSGASTPARGPITAGIGTTLTYLPADGTVLIAAGDASGGVITSFQLENADGTFAPDNYNGPVAGTFGETLEDVTTNVIADTDLTLAGIGDTLNLGTVFPIGMDLPGLQAYLTTAVYTGALGSGQMQFNLFVDTMPTNYAAWIELYPTLTDTDPSLDFDGDGLETGVEYVLGGNPVRKDSADLAPTANSVGSGLEFTFRRTDLANGDPDITILVEYGSDLLGWTTAEEGVNGVSIVATDEFYGEEIDRVVVTVPAALESGGKIFARLRAIGFPE